MAGAIAFIVVYAASLLAIFQRISILKYHLVDRVSAFNPGHVPDYLASQFSFHNPFYCNISMDYDKSQVWKSV